MIKNISKRLNSSILNKLRSIEEYLARSSLRKIVYFFPFNRNKQFFVFIIVGMINTLFGYSVFSLFIFLGMHYTLAALLGTVIGICFSFKTLGTLVFKNFRYRLFFKFVIVYTVTYFVSIGLIKCLLFFINNLYVDGAISTVCCAFVSYFFNKYFVFVRKI